MNPEIFADWYRQQGYEVLRSQSSYWADHAPRVLQAFPFHWIINPSEEELRNLMKSNGIIGLRYSTPMNANEGMVSYHAILDDKNYSEEILSKWSRKNVRRGLKFSDIEPISFDRVAKEGWALQVDTLSRQGRRQNITQKDWERKWYIARSLPGFQAWGAIVGKELAASVVTFQIDGCVYMLYQQCHSQYLTFHINNALSFVVSQSMIRQPSVTSILYGLHSLDAPASIDEFKFRMGYIPKPVRQRVVFNPTFSHFFNPLTHSLINRLRNYLPGKEAVAKAEGMIRFAIEGKKPLESQTWPMVLLTEEGSRPHAWFEPSLIK